MSGTKVLLDSNVVIFASQQLIDTDKLLTRFGRFYVSMITYMEVYGYAFKKPSEKLMIDELFQIVSIIDIDIEVANQVIAYRKGASKKIKLPDAIILATAKIHDLTLVSDDWDDFKNIDSNVTILNIDEFKR
jgi:predicted nucleic acid-binding protein